MDFLLKDAEFSGGDKEFYRDVEISTPINIPTIKSEEDAFEYLKYWRGNEPEKYGTIPCLVCTYCIKHPDGSIERKVNQLFTSTEIGVVVHKLTPEQAKLARYVVNREDGNHVYVFRSFATLKNAKILFDTLTEQRENLKNQMFANDELIPIPFDSYIAMTTSLNETKSHDISFQSFVKENNK
jgi:hypothetical protein